MSVFFLQLWSGEQGVGFCRKSKIVASLNRQLWLVYFCPPLQSISKALKKRHKKNIFAFKIYFWCCLKQFGGQEVGGGLWGFSTGLLLEVYFGWDCRSQVVFFVLFFFVIRCCIFCSLWHLEQGQKRFQVVSPQKDRRHCWLRVSGRMFGSRGGEFLGGVEALWSPRFCFMFVWRTIRVLQFLMQWLDPLFHDGNLWYEVLRIILRKQEL